MKIKIKESKKRILKEAIDLGNIYKPTSRGFIKTSFLSELFRFFHLSSYSLHKKASTFTFNPRVTKRPFEDEDSFVIEDDFTPRISLATSIEEATDALETGDSMEHYYVYASDVESRFDDNIPEKSLIWLPLELQRCKRDLSTNGNKYGPNFNLMNYQSAKGLLPKQRSRESRTRWVDRVMSAAYSNPKYLPPEHKNKFYACVPDAEETNEYWSTTNTVMYYLGTHIANSGVVVLSAQGKRLVADIMKEQGYDIP